MPFSTWAVVIFLEHTWVLGLTVAIRRTGGTVLNGGMVAPAELSRINAEWAGNEEQQYA